MGFPAGLHVIDRAGPTPEAPVAVFVHGSLDRAESFRRVMRRLPEIAVVAYDRRGYEGSRALGVGDLDRHAGDLLAVVTALKERGSETVVAIGHSVGGDVVLAAALADPRALAAVGAFEPPLPWLGFRRAVPGDDRAGGWAPPAADPGDEAERFFGRMVSPAAWRRLTDNGRAERRADGPALLADFQSIRGAPPFDVTALAVPAVIGRGGTSSAAHHRAGTEWLIAHVPDAELYDIGDAQHGAHLSHPDRFADFARRVLARAGENAVGASARP
jgi:pimeloyl-ACP methyl ester carboxylesterase